MNRLFSSAVNPDVLKIEPYKPGKPIEELQREKGLERIVKLASNENPLGPSPLALKALGEISTQLNRYPDGYGFELKQALSKLWDVSPENLVLGNGSSEIIEMMVRLFVRPGKKVVLASPSFSIYEITAIAQGGGVVNVPLKEHVVDLSAVAKAVDADTALIILGNPNNPTGTVFGVEEWERFLAAIPHGLPVLLDEAYMEYADTGLAPVGRAYLSESRPIVAARTFSKAYGLAMLRLGYALAPVEIVDYMNRLRLPFNANGAAQAAAAAAVQDSDHMARAVEMNRQCRTRLQEFFKAQGLPVIESQANYVTAKVGDGDLFFNLMLDEGVIVRSVKGFGMPEWVRISVGTPDEMAFFEQAFLRIYPKYQSLLEKK